MSIYLTEEKAPLYSCTMTICTMTVPYVQIMQERLKQYKYERWNVYLSTTTRGVADNI